MRDASCTGLLCRYHRSLYGDWLDLLFGITCKVRRLRKLFSGKAVVREKEFSRGVLFGKLLVEKEQKVFVFGISLWWISLVKPKLSHGYLLKRKGCVYMITFRGVINKVIPYYVPWGGHFCVYSLYSLNLWMGIEFLSLLCKIICASILKIHLEKSCGKCWKISIPVRRL